MGCVYAALSRCVLVCTTFGVRFTSLCILAFEEHTPKSVSTRRSNSMSQQVAGARVLLACTSRRVLHDSYEALRALSLPCAWDPSKGGDGGRSYSGAVLAGGTVLELVELPRAAMRARETMGRPDLARLVGLEVSAALCVCVNYPDLSLGCDHGHGHLPCQARARPEWQVRQASTSFTYPNMTHSNYDREISHSMV
jgi:hypothetical protein